LESEGRASGIWWGVYGYVIVLRLIQITILTKRVAFQM
jgi:hypothetical protein